MTSTVVFDKGAPTRNVKHGSMSRDRTWALRWAYFFLTIFAIFSLVPPIYMLITSLKGAARLRRRPIRGGCFIRRLPTTANCWVEPVYEVLPELGDGLDLRRDLTMLISVPAAFALSRMRFWGSATLATGVFLTYLIPDTLLFLPLLRCS